MLPYVKQNSQFLEVSTNFVYTDTPCEEEKKAGWVRHKNKTYIGLRLSETPLPIKIMTTWLLPTKDNPATSKDHKRTVCIYKYFKLP